MNNYKNILSESQYLIDTNLFKFLNSGTSIHVGGKSMVKDLTGTYLVVARVLNNNSNVIIYNYIFYPDIYNNPLKTFLLQKKDFQNSLLYSEWGDFLTVINSNELVEDRLFYNRSNMYLERYLEHQGVYTEIEIKNYNDLFIYTNKLTYISDYDILADLIDLAVKKKYKEFSNIIYNNKEVFKSYNRNISISTDLSIENNLNIINGCLFAVGDLNMFISKLKNKGYVVNAGPQKWRGQVNSMNNFLTCLDIDFRYSLYMHNEYHANKNPNWAYNIPKSKFSYRNVHQNLTGVRWYSTDRQKTNLSSSVTSVNVYRDIKKTIRENSPIFDRLYNWLGNSPINDETQEEMERFLLDYTYIGISDAKNSKALVDYSLFNNNLAKLLLNKKEDLIRILSNFRATSHNIKEGKKRVNQKEISRYYLSLLLSKVKNQDIIAIIYGRLMRIITYHNKFYSNEMALDIFQDICNNLIKDYFFILYNEEIDKLCLEKNIETIKKTHGNHMFVNDGKYIIIDKDKILYPKLDKVIDTSVSLSRLKNSSTIVT